MSEPTSSTPTAPPARRRRWVRWLVYVLLGLAGVVALAPLYLGPVLRRAVELQLGERLGAQARVHSVSFSWPARVRLRELELSDSADAPLASLDELDARLELLPLFAGKLHAEVALSYPEVHVSRTSAGLWNWEQPLARALASSEGDEDESAPESGAVPEVRARVRLTDGHVVLHGSSAATTLTDVALELAIDGLDRPAPFHLGFSVRGPEGPAGKVTLDGSFTAASAGRIDALHAAGELRLALAALDLTGLAPALELVAPVAGLEGALEGQAQFTLGTGLALSGTTDVRLRGLALRGPLAPETPARIETIELRGEASQQGDGAGTQRFELRAGELLELLYEGRSNLAEHGAGEVAGTLTLSADLGPTSALARGWIPLQSGVAVEGRLRQTLELACVLADREPVTARVRVRGAASGLAAREAGGGALDLAGLENVALELDADADLAQGTLHVPQFALRAGPVSCSGRAEAADQSPNHDFSALALRSGNARIEADLERLRGTLAQLVELEPTAFGGQLRADVTLQGEGAELELAAEIDGRALAFAGTRLASLGGALHAQRANDGTLAGSGELRLGALTLPLEGRALELPAAVLNLTLREDAAGAGEHSLGLETLDHGLKCALEAQSQRQGTELTLRNTLTLDADVARLAALAAPFAPVQPGLGGTLRVQGELDAQLAAQALTHASGKLELFLTNLALADAAGAPRRLEALGRTTLALEGELDSRAGEARLRALRLVAGGLELSASGAVRGLAPDARPELLDGRLELQADLERLSGELAQVVDLGGWSLGGGPLTAQADLSTREQRLEARGRLASASLRCTRPAAPPLAFTDVGLDFDLGYDTELGSLHVRRARLASSTGTLALSGTLNELLDPARARGAMQLELAGELARILGDLGLETGDSGRRSSGQLEARLALDGDRGAFHVTAKSTLEHFRLELAPTSADAAPLVLEDPRLALDCEARVTLERLDVELAKLTLTSELARGGARGRIENLRATLADATPQADAAPQADADAAGEVRFVGLSGQLVYVPDRLGVVLAPFLPGKLSGAEEQHVTFTLDGRARDLDLAALLLGSEMRVDLGIGHFERPEVQLGGALVVEAKQGKLLVRGDLAANGGTLKVDGTLDLTPAKADGTPPRSRLAVGAKEVRANQGLAPLLACVHPAFATAQLGKGTLDGLIGLDLDLTYDGALSLAELAAGWEALPKTPINGTGRLELRSASLRGSPLLTSLAEFGIDTQKALDVRPIDFTIQRGRVSYAKPWTWTLSGTETTFTGSLGLDQSLDLAWNLPVSERLVERYGFLASLQGEVLSIPLRGTVTKPHLEADGLLKDLAAKAAKKELESRLGLGAPKSGDDPEALLKRADDLWSANKKTEAAALYSRLREEFKLSLTYALNKDRIKERSKYKEPPR